MKSVPNGFNLQEITRLEELEDISEEWSELWSRSETTPFQTPEWLISWWKCFGTGDLFTLALRQNGRLIGLAPLYISSETDKTRSLLFIGTGITDYLDFLVDPDFCLESIEILLKYIHCRRHLWDRMDLQDIPERSSILKVHIPLLSLNEKNYHNVCPVIHVPDSINDYLSRLPSEWRRSLRRSRRTFENAGILEFKTAGEKDSPEVLEALFDLHTSRWEQENGQGVLYDSAIRDFHRHAAEGLRKRGNLALYSLRHNERIVAVVYALIRHPRLYCYLGGFNPELARLSPGALSIYLAINDCISRGITEFDFLRGEERYKYRWGAVNEMNYRIVLKREFLGSDPRGHAAFVME